MTRDQKTEMVELIGQRLDEASTIYLTDYSGLTVEKANELRNLFRDAGVEFKVLKNTLVRLAMEQRGGFDGVYDYLSGPTAVAFANEPSAPARVIKNFAGKGAVDKPKFKAAIIEGAVYHSDQLEALASLKSKDELLSDIIGLLMSPMSNVVGALESAGGNLASIVKTLAEREA